MKRFILGFVLAISIPVMAAVLWPSGAYLETFQNGFIFGTGKVLSVLNDVITFDGKRLDDRPKGIIVQEDFEGASVAFTCGANLTKSDETTAPINGVTSIDIDQAGTPATSGFGCSSPAYTLPDKAQGKFLGACVYTTWDGNDNEMKFQVFDNTALSVIGFVDITASTEPKEHCVYFNSATNTASIDFLVTVNTGNDNTTLRFDDIEVIVDPLTPTDIYASSKWENCGVVEIDAATTAPTKGTVEIDRVLCRRNGDNLEARFEYKQSAGGSVGSGDYIWRLPNGLSFDSEKVSLYTGGTGGDSSIIGTAVYAFGGGTVIAYAIPYDSTGFRISYKFGTSASVFLGSASGGLTGSRSYPVTIVAPIAGWSDTAQGVVVKNRTDSASVENVFSAKIASDGTVASESSNFIEGNCAKGGTGLYTCTLVNGLFGNAPSINSTVNTVANSDWISNVYAITTSSFSVAVEATTDFGGRDSAFEVIVQRQGTDYIKETDKVYTIGVDNLTGNSCGLEGNDGRALTAGTESIPFNGSCNGWTSGADGSTTTSGNYYTVQKNNSVIDIQLGIDKGSTSTNAVINMFKNGALLRVLEFEKDTGVDSVYGSYKSYRGEFVTGDKIAFTINQGATLINSTTQHYLNINESYGDRGTFLGTFGQPTCYVKEVLASGTSIVAAATTWNNRTLNTISGSCSFLSLASSDFTLEAGGYNVRCSAPAHAVGIHRLKLRQDPSGSPSDLLFGTSEFADAADNTITHSTLDNNISINASTTFDIQHYTQLAKAINGLGIASSLADEVYAQCEITKVR